MAEAYLLSSSDLIHSKDLRATSEATQILASIIHSNIEDVLRAQKDRRTPTGRVWKNHLHADMRSKFVGDPELLSKCMESGLVAQTRMLEHNLKKA